MQSIGENEDIAQSSDASLSARWTGVVVIANKINSRSADEDGHPAGHANGLAPPAQENITAESTDNDLGSEESSRTRCLLETTLVWTAIVVVWALLTLPIIYYHVDFKRPKPSSTSSFNEECIPYTGTECSKLLKQLYQCLMTDTSDSVLVLPRNGDQQNTDASVSSLKMFLTTVAASDECQMAAIPFTCQYLFPACDGSDGNIVEPSYEQCQFVLGVDGVCKDAVKRAEELSLADRLPDCSSLPRNGFLSNNCSELMQSVPLLDNVTCAEHFENVNGSCVARCDAWEQSPHGVTIALTVVELVAASFGLLAGITLILLSVLKRRHMFSFPSVFVVYMTISYCVVAIFVLIAYIGQDPLHCGGELSVTGALSNPTPFCTLAGVVSHYFLLSIALWWFLHVCCMFWKLQFPLHARRHQNKQIYIHAALVALGLLVPIPGVVATLVTSGYTMNHFPPLLCSTKNPNAMYYSLWIVINLLSAVGIPLIILMFWLVHKHQGIFRMKIKDTGHFHISPAEKKLLFVFIYYTLIMAVSLAYFGTSVGDQDDFVTAAAQYFACEAGGHNSSDPCPKNYEQFTHPELAAATYLLMGLIPVINMIYVIHFGNARSNIIRVRTMMVHSLSRQRRMGMNGSNGKCDSSGKSDSPGNSNQSTFSQRVVFSKRVE